MKARLRLHYDWRPREGRRGLARPQSVDEMIQVEGRQWRRMVQYRNEL